MARNKENLKRWKRANYLKNREKILAQQKEYTTRNREKVLAKKREYTKRTKNQKRAYDQIYRKQNVEEKKVNDRIYYRKNREYIISRVRRYEFEHAQIVRATRKKYTNTHRKEIRSWQRGYWISRYKNDLQYRLTKSLRGRLSHAIKGKIKGGSAVRDLGCTIEELIIHLEKQFQSGMTWENWNYGGWHIDHIVPLSYFDLTNQEQVKIACHYTNLQPMWALENIKKSNKIYAS